MSKKKSVFVITSCDIPYQYHNKIIKDITERILGLNCIIAELKYGSIEKYLLQDIFNDIKKADYIFIDLIPTNYNIAFECGIAYSLKKNFYILTPKYLFDLDKVPTNITGFKHFTYTNFKQYAEIIIECLRNEISEGPREEIDFYLNSFEVENTENFKDFNSLINKIYFQNSQISLSTEGLTISYAHYPIYFKNFGFFSEYELQIKARIDRGAVGVALHIEDEFEKNMYVIPIPIKCFMFNIRNDGLCTPHIFHRNIINREIHYWAFRNNTHTFKGIKEGNFFDMKIKVNKNIIEITINNDKFPIDIKGLNIRELDYTLCNNNILSNNKSNFDEAITDLLNGLDRGSFGFRVHPFEQATINYLKYNLR